LHFIRRDGCRDSGGGDEFRAAVFAMAAVMNDIVLEEVGIDLGAGYSTI
jgi:hypothetical protein